MKSDISKLLLRKKKLIAESWINAQLEDTTLREDVPDDFLNLLGRLN